MNNHPSSRVSNESFRHSFNLFLILCGASVLAGFTVSPVFGQKAMWRYVTTSLSGTKTYLNDERKSLAKINQGAWEKMVEADGSSVVTLVEWDCGGKSRLIRQIIYFNSRQSAVGGKDKGFAWSLVIPGSAGDFLYHRVCLPSKPPKLAQIIADRTALRAYPGDGASITRVARLDEQFQIVPESGLGGWFNLIDPATQEDYWLTNDNFKIIKAPPAPSEPQAGSGKPSRRAKPKAKVRKK